MGQLAYDYLLAAMVAFAGISEEDQIVACCLQSDARTPTISTDDYLNIMSSTGAQVLNCPVLACDVRLTDEILAGWVNGHNFLTFPDRDSYLSQ